jgi:hypothetical protein
LRREKEVGERELDDVGIFETVRTLELVLLVNNLQLREDETEQERERESGRER